MKRSYALETLSWEHHNGLVLSFRLERGLQLGVEINELKKYLLHVWQSALRFHFQVEENYLFIEACKEELQDDFNRMCSEHQEFYSIIKSLKYCEDEKKIDQLINNFYQKIKDHIRFEEREFFPKVEKALSKIDARQLGQKLHDLHEPVDLSWPVEFWKQKDGKKP
ncbi:MAG TPA: hemerythrin domain-containing protein [Caldithrix abyssi]|uniref:Hemerythrin domain-containing protein n=1 Tax=Caldithrix abyssi TaxID=187145 RepID=A0A7V5H2T4_CALAY|nr:hemerythrin domain-containing protein [Caldithrix abyssi]